MSQFFILIFLLSFGYIVYYIVNLLMKKRITESFTSPLTIDDSHHFLMTSILPAKVDIANLREKNRHRTNFYYVDENAVKLETTNPNVVTHRPSKLEFPKIKNQLTCIGENHPIRAIIQEHQPFMYDQAKILNVYDHPFYRDWRYPERPIDPRFAANPVKYCEKNPHIYPCYRFFSKW